MKSLVSPFIDFNGDVIQNVTGYKFLGCLFKSNGNLRHNLEELAKKQGTFYFPCEKHIKFINTILESLFTFRYNKEVICKYKRTNSRT
jgi:hypothetical protein